MQITRVYSDGRHNAFTSLVQWQGRLYLAFRSATSHVSPENPDGQIRILASDDGGASWIQVALLSFPGLDLRDPKLLATEKALYVHTFGYMNPYRRDANVSATLDGYSFTDPVRAADEDNLVIWWPVYYKNEFWGAGYRYHGNKKDIRSILLHSADGWRWTAESLIYDVPWACETTLHFDSEGTAYAMVTNAGYRLNPPSSNGHPVLATAKPPYMEWQYREMDIRMSGLATFPWHDTFLLVGRAHDEDDFHTAAFIIDGNRLRRLFTLPSGGDTAYPGIVRDGDSLLISYYSSHEENAGSDSVPHPSSIYLARINIDELDLESAPEWK